MAPRIATCDLNNVTPQAYVADVIAKIVAGRPQSEVEDLLAWAHAPTPHKATA